MGQSKSKSYVQKSRDRIRAGKVLPKLLEVYHGELEMTAQQVNIGLALLKKVLPDTSHQIVEGSLGLKDDRDKSLTQIYREVLDDIASKEG